MSKAVILIILLLSGTVCPGSSDGDKLREQAVRLWQNGLYDSSLNTAFAALEEAKKEKDSLLIARCLNNIGLVFSSKGEPVKSILYYSQALSMLRSLNDEEQLAKGLLNIGIAYKEQAVYDQALKYLFESAALFEQKGDKRGLSSAHNTIANILMLDKMYDKALEHHFKALSLRRELGFNEGIAGSLNNIGLVYKNQGHDDSALYYFNESLRLKDSLPSKEQLANTLTHIAEIYTKRKKYREAENYYQRALKLREDIQNQKGIAGSYYGLGKLRIQQNRNREGERYFLKAASLSAQIEASDILLKSYESLRQLYRNIHHTQKALQYDELYITLKEKLLGEAQQKALTQMQVKYETEKKQLEIKELSQDKEKQVLLLQAQDRELETRQRNIWHLQVFIVLGVLLLIFFFLYLWTRMQASKKQEMLFRELHHRIKNNLQILSSLLSLQSDELKDEKARDAVKEGQSRMRAMMLIHQKLYFDKQVNQVNMPEYVSDLLLGLCESYGYSSEKIRLDLSVGKISLDVDKAIPIGLLLNELLSNSFKYAFHENKTPELTVKLSKEATQYILQVSDNGPGLPDQTVPLKRSFGLKLVESQVKQLHGRIRTWNDKGLNYEISFQA